MGGNDPSRRVVSPSESGSIHSLSSSLFHNDGSDEIYDLADLTPQCGRKGDALKLHLAWLYYGTSGLSQRIKVAFDRAEELAALLESSENITMVSKRPLPCLQVCFYYTPRRRPLTPDVSTRTTQQIVRGLLQKGFMVDYASGERGKFFRVVANAGISSETVKRLVASIEELGAECACN